MNRAADLSAARSFVVKPSAQTKKPPVGATFHTAIVPGSQGDASFRMQIEGGHQIFDRFEPLLFAGGFPARWQLQADISGIARQKLSRQSQPSVLNSNSKHRSSPLDDASEVLSRAIP
jgi:hypothetical protein